MGPQLQLRPHSNASVRFYLLPVGDLPSCFACQVPCFGNKVDRFQNLRIAFEQNARGLRDTEPVVLKILLAELNSALREVLLELAQKSVGNLERRIDRRMLCQEIPDECVEGETAHHQRL